MSLKFDTQKAVQKLRDSGVQEPQANAMVEVVTDATSGLLTQEFFATTLRAEIQGVRAEFSHALLVLGLGLAGLMVAVAGVSLAAAALLFD